jgi:multicomponent Na+:H+ antiporter subunit F
VNLVLIAAAVAILVTMALALVRGLLGPSIYDRVLALNMVGTKTVLLISVVDFLKGPGDFLDICLVYALINFIGVVAMLRFVHFTTPEEGEGVEEAGQ